MSVKTSIQNAKIIYPNAQTTHVAIEYNGLKFHGYAFCHENDMDFCSEKVGTTIAHLRAMQNAVSYAKEKAKNEWIVLKHHYCGIMQGKDEEELDPTGSFKRAMWRAEKRYRKLQKYSRELNTELHNYLEAQNTAITSIKRHRAAKAKNN